MCFNPHPFGGKKPQTHWMPPPQNRIKINFQNRHKTAAYCLQYQALSGGWITQTSDYAQWTAKVVIYLLDREEADGSAGTCGWPECPLPIPLSFSLSLCLSFFLPVSHVYPPVTLADCRSPSLCWFLPADLSLSEHEISHLCFPVHLLFPFSLFLSVCLWTGFLISAETRQSFHDPRLWCLY